MPVKTRRNRKKSILQRIKTFFGLLRRKEAAPDIRSPTSVADFSQYQQATSVETHQIFDIELESEINIGSVEGGNKENVSVNIDNQSEDSDNRVKATVTAGDICDDEKSKQSFVNFISEKDESFLSVQEGGLPSSRRISSMSWESSDYSDKLEENRVKQEKEFVTSCFTSPNEINSLDINADDSQGDNNAEKVSDQGLQSYNTSNEEFVDVKDCNRSQNRDSEVLSEEGETKENGSEAENPGRNSIPSLVGSDETVFDESENAQNRVSDKATLKEVEKTEGEKKPADREKKGNHDDELSSSSKKPTKEGQQGNPEELFAHGEVVLVDIVAGTYKSHKQGQIVDIKKRVKLSIQHENGTRSAHWLARGSLAYMGSAFPVSGAEPENESSSDVFERNDRVWIVGGKYEKNKTGTVIEVKTNVKVAVDGLQGKQAWLSKKSLRHFVDGQSPPSTTEGEGGAQEHFSDIAAEPSSAKSKGRKTTPMTAAKLESVLELDEDWRLMDSNL